MRQLIWIMLIGAMAFSCDDRKDYLELNNVDPQVEIHGASNAWNNTPVFQTTLVDSVKLGFDYNISYRVNDESRYANLSYLAPGATIKTISGSDLNEVGEGVDKIGELRCSTNIVGPVTITLASEDPHGSGSTAIVELESFYNLLPVADFEVDRTDVLSDYEIEIDASASFDRDEKYGDGVHYYQFIINNDTTNYPSSNFRYTFPGPSTGVIICVRVKDNTGEWSGYKTITYNVL